MDNKTYKIYSSVWQDGGTYSAPKKEDGALFRDSDEINTKMVNLRRRMFKAQTAIYQGEYRKTRNTILHTRHLHKTKEFFENFLDDTHKIFRSKCSELWKRFSDKDFLPEFLTQFDSINLEDFKNSALAARSGAF
jgi:hypothetical protein